MKCVKGIIYLEVNILKYFKISVLNIVRLWAIGSVIEKVHIFLVVYYFGPGTTSPSWLAHELLFRLRYYTLGLVLVNGLSWFRAILSTFLAYVLLGWINGPFSYNLRFSNGLGCFLTLRHRLGLSFWGLWLTIGSTDNRWLRWRFNYLHYLHFWNLRRYYFSLLRANLRYYWKFYWNDWWRSACGSISIFVVPWLCWVGSFVAFIDFNVF